MMQKDYNLITIDKDEKPGDDNIYMQTEKKEVEKLTVRNRKEIRGFEIMKMEGKSQKMSSEIENQFEVLASKENVKWPRQVVHVYVQV